MTHELFILTGTAVSIGFFHTLLGPDHYVPFTMMAEAQRWGRLKTIVVTILCGLGHVLSSVVLGGLGIALGFAVTSLESVESVRGDIAAWLLIAFGLVYALWGFRRAYKNRPHEHAHLHQDGSAHSHVHSHHAAHSHIHLENKKTSITPWVLFTIFVFGPCEPLIPILMYPAATRSLGGVILVTSVFSVVTISTMVCMVLVSLWGIQFARLKKLEQYTHALAGSVICLSGLAVKFLGL